MNNIERGNRKKEQEEGGINRWREEYGKRSKRAALIVRRRNTEREKRAAIPRRKGKRRGEGDEKMWESTRDELCFH